jgi:hypothetical protein
MVRPDPPEEQSYAERGPATLVAEGRLISAGHYLDVGQQATVPITIAVPRSRFTVVSLVAAVAVAHQSLDLEPKPIQVGRHVYVLRMSDHSWLHRLTRGPQYLRVTYDTIRGHRPVTAEISRHPNRPDSASYAAAMKSVYGLTNYASFPAITLPTDSRTHRGAHPSHREVR